MSANRNKRPEKVSKQEQEAETRGQRAETGISNMRSPSRIKKQKREIVSGQEHDDLN